MSDFADRTGDRHVGAECVGRATQDDGVAGPDAETGSIGGHVGTGLVDHGDDTERDTDAMESHPVVERPASGLPSHRVGQRCDAAQTVGHGGYPPLVEAQPIDESTGDPLITRLCHVGPIRLEHCRRQPLPPPRPCRAGPDVATPRSTGAGHVRRLGRGGRSLRSSAQVIDGRRAARTTRSSRCTTTPPTSELWRPIDSRTSSAVIADQPFADHGAISAAHLDSGPGVELSVDPCYPDGEKRPSPVEQGRAAPGSTARRPTAGQTKGNPELAGGEPRLVGSHPGADCLTGDGTGDDAGSPWHRR